MKIRLRDRRVSLAIMVLGLILAAALGYDVVYGEHGYLTYRSEQRRYLELRQKTDKLQKQNEGLQKEIDSINRHDPATIERKAREQQLVKPGEKIYTYAPAGSQPGGNATQPASPPASSSSPAPGDQR
jgi:cell division protein FtsB